MVSLTTSVFIPGETTSSTCQIKGSLETGVDMEAVKRKIPPSVGFLDRSVVAHKVCRVSSPSFLIVGMKGSMSKLTY